jgi:hypothetical protein
LTNDLEVVRVRDVILCATGSDDGVGDDGWRDHPPVGFDRHEEIDLGESVILTALSSDEAEQVMDACEPRGLNFDPVRQFGQRYSFVRERPVEIERAAGATMFDEDGHLQNAFALSRLVRDNGFSLQYAARMIDRRDESRVVRPVGFTEGTAVYRLRRGREWLDTSEAKQLVALLDAYRSAPLPSRVGRALWRAEHSTWHRWADITLAELVGGLEGLLGHRYEKQRTQKFKRRVTKLAGELGIEAIDRDLCGRMYEGRSDWSHGDEVALFGREDGAATDAEDDAIRADLAKMQDVLRSACRRAIEETDFRLTFESSEAVAERWS